MAVFSFVPGFCLSSWCFLLAEYGFFNTFSVFDVLWWQNHFETRPSGPSGPFRARQAGYFKISWAHWRDIVACNEIVER